MTMNIPDATQASAIAATRLRDTAVHPGVQAYIEQVTNPLAEVINSKENQTRIPMDD